MFDSTAPIPGAVITERDRDAIEVSETLAEPSDAADLAREVAALLDRLEALRIEGGNAASEREVFADLLPMTQALAAFVVGVAR